MTSVAMPALVPPVAPPRRSDEPSPPRRGSQRPLPLAPLVAPRARSTVYGLAAVDDRGRVADHEIVRALCWRAGTRLDIRVVGGVIVVAASDDGAFSVTNNGHIRLPATVRRSCAVEPGDRVLLVAEPANGVLSVHPPAALDTMLTRLHTQVTAGDAA